MRKTLIAPMTRFSAQNRNRMSKTRQSQTKTPKIGMVLTRMSALSERTRDCGTGGCTFKT